MVSLHRGQLAARGDKVQLLIKHSVGTEHLLHFLEQRFHMPDVLSGCGGISTGKETEKERGSLVPSLSGGTCSAYLTSGSYAMYRATQLNSFGIDPTARRMLSEFFRDFCKSSQQNAEGSISIRGVYQLVVMALEKDTSGGDNLGSVRLGAAAGTLTKARSHTLHTKAAKYIEK